MLKSWPYDRGDVHESCSTQTARSRNGEAIPSGADARQGVQPSAPAGGRAPDSRSSLQSVVHVLQRVRRPLEPGADAGHTPARRFARCSRHRHRHDERWRTSASSGPRPDPPARSRPRHDRDGDYERLSPHRRSHPASESCRARPSSNQHRQRAARRGVEEELAGPRSQAQVARRIRRVRRDDQRRCR